MGETDGDCAAVEAWSEWARVAGLWVHYRVAGEAAGDGSPAVVLVHGLIVSSRYMVPTLGRLARYYRVYAPDLPGFGKSESPPDALDVPGLSGALCAWMEAMGLEGAVLVANSMGCQVVANLAVCRPELVGRAVLQAPTMDPQGRSVSRQAARFLLDVTREPPSLIPVELRDLLSAGPWRGWRTLRHALEDHIEENLPRVMAPALVVRGSRDPICPQRWAEEVAQLLPRGRLAVLPGAAHAANFGAPARFAGLIQDFLEERAMAEGA
ncbi:MAG: alpha/beta hydrolase [Actinomycetota bacterium]|nr:alpha/beta hydrolase [Actinomycetota bacterium]